MAFKYSEARLFWPPFVPFKAVQLTQVDNLWKPLDTTETELYTITWANVHFGVQNTGGRVWKQVYDLDND
jgi:hypothetical protein